VANILLARALFPPARATTADQRSITDEFDNENYVSSLYETRVTAGRVEVNGTGVAGWWDSDWLYSIGITIDSADIDEALTNFPLMVYLNSTRITWAQVQDDLDDLRFIDSSNSTVLDHEIESYTVNTDAWLWVEIPSISNTSDTLFYCYYGNDGASSVEDQTGTWDDANFAAVTHMDDINSTHVDDSTDTTTMSKGGNTVEITGIIGDAQDFDGSGDYITVSPRQLSTKIHTVEAWVRADTSANMMVFGSSSSSYYPMYLAFDSGAVGYRSSSSVSNTSNIIINSWIHYCITRTGTTVNFYLNGTLEGTQTLGASVNNRWDFISGYNSDPPISLHFHGIIDEVRGSNNYRSAAWVKASYESGRDDLLSYGAAQSGVTYASWGTLYSVNMVRDLNSSDVLSLWYNCVIQGSETIDIQFSSDNSTFSAVLHRSPIHLIP